MAAALLLHTVSVIPALAAQRRARTTCAPCNACSPHGIPLPPTLPTAVILQVAGNTEKRGRTQKAIVLYGTHLRCMAVYCFKVRGRARVACRQRQWPESRSAPHYNTTATAQLQRMPRTPHCPIFLTASSQEFDRKNADELINVAASCRRIATHRATLQQRAIRK